MGNFEFNKPFDTSNFEKQFDKMGRRFSLVFGAACAGIGLVFIVIMLYWVLVGTVLVKSASYIEQHGLKSVVDQVWNGKENADGHN